MKRIVFALLAVCVFSTTAWAAKTTYIVNNRRFNYVKLKEVKGSVAETRGMTHPVTLNEKGLRAALESIKLSRTYIIKKEADTQEVFSEYAIEFLVPAMVQAFKQATPMEEVVISYLNKNPIFILRNDRINIAVCWVQGNMLHVKFKKLFAKVTGDVDKRGNERKAVARARGLRVNLDLQPGQMLAVNDTDEVILDLNYNYVKQVEKKEEVREGVTMSGEKMPMAVPAPADAAVSDEREAKGMEAAYQKKKKEKVAAKEEAEILAADTTGNDVKGRLKKLEELHKESPVEQIYQYHW